MTPRARYDACPSDVQLITAVAAGSDAALEVFVARFRNLIRSCISRTLVRSGMSAETDVVDDVHADVLLAVLTNDFRRLRQYRRDRGCAVSSWIGLITVSTTLDYVRRERRQRYRTVDDDELEACAPPVPGPDVDYEAYERIERLNEALRSCSPRDREFARLYFVDGLSATEVAAATGVQVQTVYSRRVKLERRLTRLVAA